MPTTTTYNYDLQLQLPLPFNSIFKNQYKAPPKFPLQEGLSPKIRPKIRVYGVKTREDFKQAAKLGASGFTCDFWDAVFKWAKELGADYNPAIRK